ncbi:MULTISPECIES: hypothetical protein [Alicyclobacillus]|uniref:Uncharacterized protein n=1 Tax=Alicyclobacillus acidoterrestris (strain ATCC 49025 / DSM 3922 / CIP 106132 / NCIMB 13137 / GD3B) TaxID=1356854 RepID=T0C4D8_ALIAG|nr:MULTISPECIES: hypothetical protein [Alicyclobacillus]EPZ47874.1 hypothetical protein N007_04760 [Alicyclobacillus acidoterrestris ATCC 49025]UNO51059.1 hypothetical protein K1I37_21010 [Alicyclobacillus acidoterrestris]GEO27905.1 hypothetical protein AAC03nite_36900 [Alicyclobacillus acidoterrestris]
MQNEAYEVENRENPESCEICGDYTYTYTRVAGLDIVCPACAKQVANLEA